MRDKKVDEANEIKNEVAKINFKNTEKILNN